MSRPVLRWRPDRWVLGLTLVLWLAVTVESVAIARALEIRPESALWLVFLLAWGGILSKLLAVFIRSLRSADPVGADLTARFTALRPIARPLFVLFACASPVLVLFSARWAYPFDRFMGTYLFRALLFWLAVLAGGSLLKVRRPESRLLVQTGTTAVLYALIYRFAMFLPMISGYPFAIDWSDTSHIYYTSLFFADRFYNVQPALPVLNPARYLLQSIPFLLGSSSLLLHRSWQAALWIASHLLTGWALTHRLRSRGGLRMSRFLFGAWAVLFLLQGPVWYYLSVIIIVVLLGTDPDRPGRTLVVVAAASVWAGLSRINWMPFPAVLAIVLYLLEKPRSEKPLFPYLAPPLIWGVVGVSTGFLVQWLYAMISGNPIEYFSTSLTSDLLWYRLWPNSTFVLGQIPGVLLILVPPALMIAWRLRDQWNKVGGIALLGVLGALGLYLVGGLVVSVKIGGGDNLHNMDGFIVLLLVIASSIALRPRIAFEEWPPLLAALLIAVPASFALMTVEPLPVLDGPAAREDLVRLNELVAVDAPEGQDVLFITERHVIPFRQVQSVRLVEAYEKVMLMEMAMAHNEAYIGQFQADLAAQRFALIVADHVNYTLLTRARAYSEENNIWDQNIDYYLVCHYEVIAVLESADVDVLQPRLEPKCPPRLADPVE